MSRSINIQDDRINIPELTAGTADYCSHVVMRLRGNYDWARWIVALQDLDAHDRDAIVNLREVRSTLSLAEAYQLAVSALRLPNLCRHRLALVDTLIDIPAAGLFTLCESDRGLQVGTFAEEASARLWLADEVN